MRECTWLVKTLLGYATRIGDFGGLYESSSRKKISFSVVPEIPVARTSTGAVSAHGMAQAGGGNVKKTSWAGEKVIVEEESN
jgi:hypothetical protein